MHSGPGVDALASSQSFWLVWLPSHEELHRLGRRVVALTGPAWSSKSIHKVTDRDIVSPLRTTPAVHCPWRRRPDPASDGPRPSEYASETGVSVRAGAGSGSGDSARTDSAYAISSAL